MKVYLDDERATPTGWRRVYTPAEAIELLKTGAVEEISLDHDLGDDEGIGTGYDVLLWIEEQVHTNDNFIVPEIKIHSQNAAGRQKMKAAIEAIYRADYHKNRT